MRIPPEIREQFRKHGRTGGQARARRLSPGRRTTIARRAGLARWTRARFGEASFGALGLPGGELVDTVLSDLAGERVSRESLLVSLAAPRLRREGVPVTRVDDDPEERLYELLARDDETLAHHRYLAYLQQMHSFANACHMVRRDRPQRAV